MSQMSSTPTYAQVVPFEFAGYQFHSRRVVTDFLLTFLAMFLVPLSTFYGLQLTLSATFNISQNTIITVSGILSVLSVWIVMGLYTYSVINDPNNFSYEQQTKHLNTQTNPFVKAAQKKVLQDEKVQERMILQQNIKPLEEKVKAKKDEPKKEKLKLQLKQKLEKEQKQNQSRAKQLMTAKLQKQKRD